MLKQILVAFIAAATSIILSLAQTPNANVAAVDTLTKDVATAVFANRRGAKAGEILNQLAGCGGNCDVVSIIRTVGGWEPVGDKMEELGRIKNTAQFQTQSPGDANAAIRQQLAQFYSRYKDDRNYGIPLSPAVQTQLLAKIDRMLPPAVDPRPAPSVASYPADGAVEQTAVPSGNANIDSDAIRMSQLEREVKEERENRTWMLILGGIGWLFVIVAIFYFRFSSVRELRSRKPRPRLPDSIIANDQT